MVSKFQPTPIGNIDIGKKVGKRREGVRYAYAHTPLPNGFGKGLE
jgi:hypothetical protein